MPRGVTVFLGAAIGMKHRGNRSRRSGVNPAYRIGRAGRHTCARRTRSRMATVQRVFPGFAFFFGVAGGTTTTGQGARRMSPEAVLPAKRS